MKCVSIVCAMGLICLTALWPSDSSARDAKVVLLAGKKSHAPGEHEYEKGMDLFKLCLDTSLSVRGVVVEVHTNGWPQDETTLDDADTIVLFSDGGNRGNQHPLLAGGHMAVLEKQMKRGCGLVAIHWSLNLPSKIGSDTLLQWIGGFKDYENPPRPLGEQLRVADWSKQQKHPICRGLKPFDMPDDEYKTPERLLSDKPGFVPILPFPGKPGAGLWAWAWQRPGGGRGFGYIGGHDHCTEDALDVNKDGLVDVVNAGYQPDMAGVLWHENPGSRGGKWKVHRVHDSPSMEGIVLADMDGDGDTDVLLNHFRLYGGLEGEGAVARIEPIVWLESIDKEPWLVKRVIADAVDDHGCGVGDINGDGRLDVVTSHGWYEAPLKPADGKWRFHRDYDLPHYDLPFRASHPMLVTDVNDDGLYALINRGLTPIPKSENPNVPLKGEKRPELK